MFLFASQLRSRFSTSPPSPRSCDRPLPPFLFRFRRRDRSSPARRSIVASAASPPSFFSRHDVTAAAALIQTPSAAARTFAATPVLARRRPPPPPPPPLPAMAICKFYQQGNCKFGNSCRFEHPKPQNQNRFGALGGGAAAGGQNALTKYSVSGETIEKDLTLEKPQWILSAYGPGRDAPDQLFGGYPREQSFEELRLHYLAGKASGNEQQALNEAQQLYQNAQQQMETALRDVQGAARFIVERESQHPNRHDVCREGTQGAPFGEFERLARLHNPPAALFGQPSALGQKPNPFGTPAFGQPAQPAAAFGQPSQPASAFGQPSQQSSSSSPFGQAAQGGASAFGQAAQPASAFGQASALGAKPNPFGAPAFGQPAQPSTQGSAFGQTGQLGQKPNPFGSNANTNAAPGSSPFGTMGAGAGDKAPATSPFGAQTSGPANAAPNPFSSAAPNQNATSPFAHPGGQTGASPFATSRGLATQPLWRSPQQEQKPAAGAAPAGNPYPPGSAKQHPPIESYTARGMDGSLSAFKGKPVSYKDGQPGLRAFDGTWTRIWFPNGPPPPLQGHGAAARGWDF
ncbi:hypothetical protein ACCO45_013880 [Purpureocillium lilacinum]|uniref:Uncharacterized protein n=1 Tax=Purpureocillium lilacinum TaxID=33203 RepID=A0ACC4DA61_PURLI